MLPLNIQNSTLSTTQGVHKASPVAESQAPDTPSCEVLSIGAGAEFQEATNSLENYTLGNSLARQKVSGNDAATRNQVFFMEDTPDDVLNTINGSMSLKDTVNLSATNTYNHNRRYSMAVRQDFFARQAMSIMPSFLQSFVNPVAHAIQELVGPKVIAHHFNGCLQMNSLALTEKGMEILKHHHIDTPLSIQRLHSRESTVEKEIQKRETARGMLNEANAQNKLLNFTTRFSPECIEMAVSLLADELLTIDELIQFLNLVPDHSNHSFILKSSYDLLNKKMIPVDQFLFIMDSNNGYNNLWDKSVHNAFVKGILTIDQVKTISKGMLLILHEIDFKKDMISLGLVKGQDEYWSTLHNYDDLYSNRHSFDFSPNGLKNFEGDIRSYEELDKKAFDLLFLMNSSKCNQYY